MWEQRERWPRRTRSYLYNAVRNHALKYVTHRGRVRQWQARWRKQGRVRGMGEPPAEADSEFHAMEIAAAFQQAVRRLPERCRYAYRLRYERGMSYAEIAAVMGTSVRTVDTQLARADKALRRELAIWL